MALCPPALRYAVGMSVSAFPLQETHLTQEEGPQPPKLPEATPHLLLDFCLYTFYPTRMFAESLPWAGAGGSVLRGLIPVEHTFTGHCSARGHRVDSGGHLELNGHS